MKKVLLITIVALCLGTAAKAQIRVGGLLGYGSEVENLAIGGIGEFVLNDKMAISPSLVLYFPKKDGPVKTSVWELNGNFNYYFLDESSVALYGIGGLNFTSVKVKVDGDGQFFDDYSDSETEIGLNIGMGVNVKATDKILPFSEIKYVISDFDQLALYFGVKFVLN